MPTWACGLYSLRMTKELMQLGELGKRTADSEAVQLVKTVLHALP
jgi:hypothetical protein